jgi:hypothetical protein
VGGIARVARSRGLQARELGGHCLAEHDAAGAHQRDHGGVRFRSVTGIDRGAVGGREIDGVEDILHADRQPAQRSLRASRRLRAASRRRDVERGEGADLRFSRGDCLRTQIDHRQW